MSFIVGFAFEIGAADWTQYRGPNHDGVSTEMIQTDWVQQPPRLLWKIPIEPAFSSFAVSGGKAFTQVRRLAEGRDQEFCIALDADTGAELWATRVDIADYDNGGGLDDGPRSTPTVEGDRVYVLSSHLRMVCLNAATGQEIWAKDLLAEFGGRIVTWQNAASPLLMGDLLFMNCNGPNQRLLALRKQDGSIVWKGEDDPMTQSTPVLATVANVPQVIFFAQSGLVSVAPETGSVLWRYAFPFSISTAASPVVGGDIVYCSAAYGNGAGAVRVTASEAGVEASEVWRTPGANMNHWATPVHHQGYLYGIYGQSLLTLRCVELATGTEMWRQSGVGYGSVLFVGGHVLVFTERGDLVLVKPDPLAYTEVARFKAVDGKCWNVPAISNGRIYARSTTEAAAYSLAPELVPPSLPKSRLTLQPELADGSGLFRLLITTEDGSPLEASRAAKVDVYFTFDLGVNAANWTKLNEPLVLTNGQLRIDDSQFPSAPQRFFIFQERP